MWRGGGSRLIARFWYSTVPEADSLRLAPDRDGLHLEARAEEQRP